MEEVNRADMPLKPKEKLTIFGDSGTERYSGFFYEDPSPQWRDDQRAEVVENMRRTDATVKAALTVVKTPMVSTTWSVVINSEDPKDIEIKDFVQRSINSFKKRTWKEFIREAFTYLDFGFSVFEKEYGLMNDRVTIVDLQPRIQSSIYKWEMNEGGDGVTQFVKTNDISIESQGFISIPIQKLAVFTNEMEGDDITGQSILRSAYKHFYAKDNLYRFGLIASERFGSGTLIIGLPPDSGDAERSAAIDMGKSFKTNEMAYLIKPSSEWEINILRPEGSSQNSIMEEQIKHHDREILMSVLAAFMDLGSGSSGSFALSATQSDFFLKNVEDKLEYFSEKFTKEVVYDIVKQAYPDDYLRLKEEDNLPYLTYSPIGERDLKVVSEYIKTLVDSGMIKPDVKMIKWIRDIFKLPELTNEEIEEQQEADDEVEEMPEQEAPYVEEELPEDDLLEDEELAELGASTLQRLAQKKKFELARPITLFEKNIDYKALNESFNTLETNLAQQLEAFFNESIDKGMKKAEAKLKSDDLAGIASLSFVAKNTLKSILKDIINQALEVGKQTASDELKVERPKTPAQVTKFNNFEAEQLTNEVINQIESSIEQPAKTGIQAGVASLAILIAMRREAEKSANKMNNVLSGSLVGEQINKGRRIVFEGSDVVVQAYMRSEILDDRTCNVCMSLDRRVVKADDPFSQMSLVHNNCRGIWVAIGKDVPTIDEVQDVTLGIPKTVRDSFETVGGVPQRDSFVQLKKPINRSNKEVQNEIKRRKS